MTGKTAKAIFWVGTLSSLIIFLWLTYDFHQQEPKYAKTDKISDQVMAGKKVWHKYNCNDCHTILGFGAYYAPDMTKAYFRLGENNIVSIVMNPEKVYKNSFRKMPHLGVTKEEAVQSGRVPQAGSGTIENRHWPPQDEKFVKAYRLRETNAQKAQQGRHRHGRLRRLPQLGEPRAEHRRRFQRYRQNHQLRPRYTGKVHPRSPIRQTRYPACLPRTSPRKRRR